MTIETELTPEALNELIRETWAEPKGDYVLVPWDAWLLATGLARVFAAEHRRQRNLKARKKAKKRRRQKRKER